MSHDHPHPHTPPGQSPGFTSVHPILNVASVPASLAYYAEKLGFVVCWAWSNTQQFNQPTEPTYAEVQRGHVILALAQGEQGGPGMWNYVNVNSVADLEALHAEYVRSGARIAAPPSDRPWGMREMLVEDPDGHTLRVGAPLPHGH